MGLFLKHAASVHVLHVYYRNYPENIHLMTVRAQPNPQPIPAYSTLSLILSIIFLT